jgi:hypothetical protein
MALLWHTFMTASLLTVLGVVQDLSGRLQRVRDLRGILVLVAVERHLRVHVVLLRLQPPPLVRALSCSFGRFVSRAFVVFILLGHMKLVI